LLSSREVLAANINMLFRIYMRMDVLDDQFCIFSCCRVFNYAPIFGNTAEVSVPCPEQTLAAGGKPLPPAPCVPGGRGGASRSGRVLKLFLFSEGTDVAAKIWGGGVCPCVSAGSCPLALGTGSTSRPAQSWCEERTPVYPSLVEVSFSRNSDSIPWLLLLGKIAQIFARSPFSANASAGWFYAGAIGARINSCLRL